MKRPVSSTRSSLTCRSSGISVISSRNSVPPLARSKKPRCWRSAPVKLPFSWPKISLSIRLGEMAPQFTARKGCLRRRLKVCTVCATSSLPVPLSAGDEDRDARARHAGDLLIDTPHGRRPPPQVAEVPALGQVGGEVIDLRP